MVFFIQCIMKKTTFLSLYVNRILAGLLIWLLLLVRAGVSQRLFSDEPAPETGVEEHPTRDTQEELIRVVLMNQENFTYYYPSVTVCCQGETIVLEPESPKLKDGSFLLQAGEEGFTVPSIERSCGIPHYQGNLTVYSEEEGLLLVNTLGLEDYLKSVLPSEMPASYEKEALKAQAICARTYALKQMAGRRMEQYHADVDDSVACQVYGNIQREARTDKAVEETAGLVLTQKEELIEACYFSTSSGQTSTNEIWNGEESLPYLQSVPCPFDTNTPWGAWEVAIPWESLQEQILEMLDPGKILWDDFPEGTEYDENLMIEEEKAYMKLTGIEITKTSESGAVTELTVSLEKEEELPKKGQQVWRGSAVIHGEYQVRTALSPKGCTIQKQDKDTVPGGALLPSAYLSLTVEAGEQAVIHGRGYGHGVGMSQTAANEMAKEGYVYEDILHYFFCGVTISRDK